MNLFNISSKKLLSPRALFIGSTLSFAAVLCFHPLTLTAAMDDYADEASNEEEVADTVYSDSIQLVQSEQYGKALEGFRQLVSENPRDARAWNMIGYCSRKQGDLDTAFAAYEKALEIQPNFPAAREYLAEAHLQAMLEQASWLRDNNATDELADLEIAFEAVAAKVRELQAQMAPPVRNPYGQSNRSEPTIRVIKPATQ